MSQDHKSKLTPTAPSAPPALVRVLVVDDEKDNLDALNRLLRLHFNVTTTTSPLEAMKLLTKEKFEVLVSDQRMPEMTGVELLEKAKLICPETMRILLTGYTDIDSVIGAINRGNIYRYVAKPWDPEDLKLTLRQASDAFRMRRELTEKNEQLKRNLVALESVDRAKARFFSLISHELKTPLTVLNSFIGLLDLSRSELKPDMVKAVEKLNQASSRFSEVIHEVLSFVKLEAEPQWDLSPVALLEEVLHAKSEIKTDTEKRKITFSVKPVAHPQILSAKEPLRDALRRLFADAIAKAPDGSEVKITITANGNGCVVIERSGPAIEAGAFEPLEVSGNLFHHHKDLGLNLAMARLILERLSATTTISNINAATLKINFPLA